MTDSFLGASTLLIRLLDVISSDIGHIALKVNLIVKMLSDSARRNTINVFLLTLAPRAATISGSNKD